MFAVPCDFDPMLNSFSVKFLPKFSKKCNIAFTVSFPFHPSSYYTVFLGPNDEHHHLSSPILVSRSLQHQPLYLLFVSIEPLHGKQCYDGSVSFDAPRESGHKGDVELPVVCQKAGSVLIMHTSLPYLSSSQLVLYHRQKLITISDYRMCYHLCVDDLVIYFLFTCLGLRNQKSHYILNLD